MALILQTIKGLNQSAQPTVSFLFCY